MSGEALAYRRVVPRHRWTEAFALLKRSKGAFLAEATPNHAVFIRCSRKAAIAIEHLSSTAPRGVGNGVPLPPPPPEPSAEWLRSDPLEQAFRRMKAEARARAEQEAA